MSDTQDKDLTVRDDDGSNQDLEHLGEIGELGEPNLRGLGPAPALNLPVTFDQTNFTRTGASLAEFTATSVLPRSNYESFRSLRLFKPGVAVLAPSSGATFSSLSSFTIPGGFAAVITGLGQWIGDASAYNKSNGDPDDITWRITINNSPVFDYGSFRYVISTLEKEAKLYFIAAEDSIVELLATNNIVVGSPGAHDIAVKGFLTGHQFPMDEINDIFRNR